MPKLYRSFSLLEIIIVIAIISILSVSVYIIIRPADFAKKAESARAIEEIKQLAEAVKQYFIDNRSYPADVTRDLPPGIKQYLTSEIDWPDGPIAGTVYDYDNWTDQTCVDSAASGSIQITLRQIPGRNPDGSNVWAWYYPIQGKGTPHCSSATEWNKGECISCPGFVP